MYLRLILIVHDVRSQQGEGSVLNNCLRGHDHGTMDYRRPRIVWSRAQNRDYNMNSKLDWNGNLAAIFEAKLTFNRPSSSVPFYCICRRG